MMASPSVAQNVTFDIQDVSPSVARKFKQDFVSRQLVLEQYLDATKFVPLFAGDIHVKVHDYSPPTSHALLPAWQGHRGEMEFAASRAIDGKAAVLHELAHVHAPNEVRFLTEGYSTYLEEMIGNIGSYPTFGKSVEVAIKEFGDGPLAVVKLDRFDAVATQPGHEIGSNVGLEVAIPADAQVPKDKLTYAYLISASFVKFLINEYGIGKFKTLYALSPLTPGVATLADPARYQTVYGKSLAQLESEWRSWFASQ
jgi:hypothetical protein